MTANTVDIKFGYSCNNNCLHCVIAGKREELIKKGTSIDRDAEEIKELINNAAMMGAQKVVFTGGEVTIRNDFLELLAFAVSLGLGVILQTNGRMFCRRDFAEDTINTSPTMHFEVALHSHKAEHHDRITRVKGSFRETTNGIKNLRELGAKSIGLKVVISRINYKDLPAMVLLGEKLGIDKLDLTFPHGMGNALKYWYMIVPRYSEIKDWIIKSAKLGQEIGIPINFEAVPFCFLKKYEFMVSELDYLKLSMMGRSLKFTHLHEPYRDWEQIRLSAKSKSYKCVYCKYNPICEGVWSEYIVLYGEEEFIPIVGGLLTEEEILKLFKRREDEMRLSSGGGYPRKQNISFRIRGHGSKQPL